MKMIYGNGGVLFYIPKFVFMWGEHEKTSLLTKNPVVI